MAKKRFPSIGSILINREGTVLILVIKSKSWSRFALFEDGAGIPINYLHLDAWVRIGSL